MPVPMSLDDDIERRIRKKEKVMSLDDDDDYANLEKVKRKKKIMSIDVDAVRVGRMMPQKIENQNKISDDDLKLPSMNLWKLEHYLPALAGTFGTKDWSLLQKYCFWMDSSSMENLSFEEALKHELVATCFWFLLTKTSPLHVKEGVASALKFILSRAPKATDMNMLIDQEEGVFHAPRKVSIDQAFIDSLVLDALVSGDAEIIRQVCWTIVFVGYFHLTDTVGTSIQNQLVELACSFSFSRDTRVATSVLAAIHIINKCIEDGVMREKLVEAVLSDREWLLNIMRDPDEELVQEAYTMLESIIRGKYYDGIWEALVGDIFPAILKRCGGCAGYSLSIFGAKFISNTIKGASPNQIKKLVDDDCIWVLLCSLDLNDKVVTSMCMEAFEKILKAGADESSENIYAKMICGYENIGGWDLLDNDAPNSEDILLKYAPRKWLLSNMAFKLLLWERGEDVFN